MSWLSQLKFMITDWWKSRDRRPVDYTSVQAIRDASGRGSARGAGASGRDNVMNAASEANERYRESFDKKA